IKPQAALLFFAALALWVAQSRRWLVLAGLASGLGGGLVIPMLLNPAVVGQYIETTSRYRPEQYASPTWGTVLRVWFGQEHFWLQFIPPLVGLAWLLWFWPRKRHAWSWRADLPLVLLVSVVTMAYGWFYDLVLVLPAV